VQEIKTYLKKQSKFDLEDVLDPLVEKRIVWKKRHFKEGKGCLELMEICGKKARVAACIFYDFTITPSKIILVNNGNVCLRLRRINSIYDVARGLENTTLARFPEFRRRNLRTAVKRLLKENLKKKN